MRGIIMLHDQKSAGYSANIREDNARLAEVLDRVVGVLTQLETRLASNGNGVSKKPAIGVVSEGTLKLVLVLALAVALGRLGSEGATSIVSFLSHLLGWGG